MATVSYFDRHCGLSASTLKIIACVAMFIDHLGVYVIPEPYALYCRIVGRLAFPIFAFFIAQGCRYTHNKLKRFLLVFGLGVLCEAMFFVRNNTFNESFVPQTFRLEGNILLTFSFSILIIYAIQAVKKALAQRKWLMLALSVGCFLLSLAASYFAHFYIPFDYGLYGIALPAFAVLLDYKKGEVPEFLKRWDRPAWRLLLFAVGMTVHWLKTGGYILQFFAYLALVPLAFYNGKPGNRKLKYAFYLFYPWHLVVVWLIAMLVKGL